MAKIPKKLGELLVENNLLTEQQLLGALALQKHQRKPLGEILVEQGYLDNKALETLLARQYGSKLGEILIAAKTINFDQLQHALNIQHESGPRSIGKVLVDLGYIKEDDLLQALSTQYQLERASLETCSIDPIAFAKIPLEVLKHYQTLPIKIERGFLVVATSDPEDVLAVTDMEFISGMHIRLVLALPQEIQSFLS